MICIYRSNMNVRTLHQTLKEVNIGRFDDYENMEYILVFKIFAHYFQCLLTCLYVHDMCVECLERPDKGSGCNVTGMNRELWATM